MVSKTFKWFLIAYIIFLLIGSVILFIIEKGDWVIFLNQHMSPVLDTFFKYWTHLGDGIFVVVLIFVFLFVKYRYTIIFMMVGAIQGILSAVLKRLVFTGSMRPKKFLEGIYELQLVEGVAVHSYHSFPSGHTMTAFSIATFLSLIATKKHLGPILFLYALLVGFSRNYLSQHFFQDIFAGSILGVVTTYLVWKAFSMKERRDWLNGSLRDKF